MLYYDGVVVENLTDEVDGEFDLYAVWAANEYTVKFNANGGKGVMADQTFLYDEVQALRANGFVRAGCEFLGWAATEDGGSTVYADGEAVSNLTVTADGVVNLCAVWEGTATTWMEDDGFSAAVANTYDGYMIDENYNLLGIVQVKTTKQSVKTTTDKKTKVKTVTTNITATATVTDANGKKWSYSKGVVAVDGVVTGLKCTTKGCPVPEFGVKVGKNGMEGVWSEYAIFGARNGMGAKGDAMKAALEAYKGKWSVSLCTSGEDAASPLAVRLQLDVQAKGVVKIAGNWESGAKVSASAQLVMGDGFVYVPVAVKATKTSPALNALIRIAADGEVALVGEGELVAGGLTVEALGTPTYESSAVLKGGAAFRARVAVNELAYPAKFAAKGLPSGLKWTEKDVYDKKSGSLLYAAGSVYGVPTKAGSFTVYFKLTRKETVGGKLKSVTRQASATFTVDDLYSWAQGTFRGDSEVGPVTLTVGKTGKVSGKWTSEGQTWTFSAASYDAYVPSERTYLATVQAKSGKETKMVEVAVRASGADVFLVR